jgi:hypothetical protein
MHEALVQSPVLKKKKEGEREAPGKESRNPIGHTVQKALQSW